MEHQNDEFDEKTVLLDGEEKEDSAKRDWRFGKAPVRRRRVLSFSIISTFALLFIVFGYDGLEDFDGQLEFDWNLIAPSEKLVYTPCFSGFQCARLIVPLDYAKNSSEKAIIAIAKYPAQVGEDSEEWGGPVLVNPGGPGGSGTELVFSAGKELQAMTGKQFSIVGFEPRGVGRTVPVASCYNSEVDRTTFEISNTRVLSVAGDDVQGEFFARKRGVAALCKDSPGMAHASYMGTASVARDMDRINEEEWAAAGKKPKGLQYWGFSYGTVLGATYATIFPDKVERLVLDGVVDAGDYMSGNWSKNLIDTEKGVDKFYEYCAASENCALNTGNSTETELRERAAKVLKTLKRTPIAASVNGQLQIISYSYVIKFMFRTLYHPLYTFPGLADVLAALEKGDSTNAVKKMQNTLPAIPRLTCDAEFAPNRMEAGEAILCSDADRITDGNEEYIEYYKKLKKQSPAGADSWALIRASCLGWGFEAVERITDFGAKTKSPILFIGNTRDPVTPLVNAKAMSTAFDGSVVLAQDSEGHCSDNNPSLCTIKAIQEYFGNGTLPAPGTMCLPELRPFEYKEAPTILSTEVKAMLAIAKARMRAKRGSMMMA